MNMWLFMRLFAVAITLNLSTAMLTSAADVSETVPADSMQKYIVTGKAFVSPYLYKNPTPGAVHMFRASNGSYYSYDSGADEAWPIHKSSNLINFQRLPSTAKPLGTWGKSRFWVPEVIEYNGKYYMYYCARSIPNQVSNQIGLAIADKPEGPFYDIGHPLFTSSEAAGMYGIDPNPFIDPDTGEKYLFFVSLGQYTIPGTKMTFDSSRIFGVRLADDMKSIVGKPQQLVTPSQTWEYLSVTRDGKASLWLEAPEILKRNGTYYIMYSANLYLTASYALGYATAPHPLGPYSKYEHNPVVSSVGEIEKAGHNSILRSPDGSEYFTSYTTLGDGRFSSRIGFRADGTMYVNGPIAGYQVMPSGTHDYVNHTLQAQVTASSTRAPYQAQAVNDGEIGVYERLEKYEWMSDGEQQGAWIRLAWDEPRSVEYIMLYDSALTQRMLKTGRIILNDDPKQTINSINFPPGSGEAAILRFPEKKELKSITFMVDQLLDPKGIAGLSEITVLGPPLGHVWLSSPIHGSRVTGTVPVQIQGVHAPVAKVEVTVTRVPTDNEAVTSLQLYAGSSLPDNLVFNSLQVEDGIYDINYCVEAVDGKMTTVVARMIVSNWNIVEDNILPPITGGWFGDVVKMLTVASTGGWEFSGSHSDQLFGDIDRIQRKTGMDESLTWKQPQLHNFNFTVYSRTAELAGAVKVAVSANGETWTPVAYTTKALEQGVAGWLKLALEGVVSEEDAAYIRLTFSGSAVPPSDLQLGHVMLRGLVQP